MSQFPIGPLIQGASEARNAFVGGRRQRDDDQLATAMQLLKLKREQEEQGLRNAFMKAQTSKLLQPPAPPRDYEAEHRRNRDYDNAHPAPTAPKEVTPDREVLPVVRNGKRIYAPRAEAIGQEAPTPEPRAEPSPVIVQGTNPDGTPAVFRVPKESGPATPVEGIAPKVQGGQGTQSRAARVQALANTSDALNAFEQTLTTIGATITPGVSKSALQTDYENLQLQMKEMYNLGVLNGPDLALMRRIIDDPTDIKGRAMALGSSAEQTKRIQAQIGQVRQRLEGFKKNLTAGQDALGGGRGGGRGAAPPTPAQPAQGGGRTITVNGKTFRVPE